LDPPDNQFRIRLVCTLLDSCGQYFDHGNSKKKLDCFLLYFQVSYKVVFGTRLAHSLLLRSSQRFYMYKKDACYFYENRIFPIDIEYVYTETLNALKPNFKYATTYAQACELVAELEKEMRDSLAKSMQAPQSDTLEAINEYDEQADEDDEYESDSYQQLAYDDEKKHVTSCPRAGYEDDEGENDDSMGASKNQGSGPPRFSNMTSVAGGNQSSDDNEAVDLSDKEDANVVLQSRPKAQFSTEDEDFIKAFDSVIVENVTVGFSMAFGCANAPSHRPY
jgi:regulator of nonsense transcripts 2